MSPSEFAKAWQSLVVDPDHLQALSDNMDSSTPTILGLAAAHPNNRDLEALKLMTALKHAPKYSWKQLCLAEKGGGSDRLQVFLGERSQGGDEHTRALARNLLSLFHLVDYRFTVQQNVKKEGPRKAEGQRKDMMFLVYQTIKAYKRLTCKNSASSHLDTEILLKDHGVDILNELSQLNERSQSLKRGLAEGSGYTAPPKAARHDSSETPSLPGVV
jgi:hypothetical protein